MPSPIQNIGQIAINTHDVARAVAFYRDALGLDYLFEAGPLAFFMCGDVRLVLSVARAPSSTTRARSSTSAWATSTSHVPSSLAEACRSTTSRT
jgi:catechol 2,3-dioxygenase-like lactoylglutathione lyase family enzyme